MLSLKNETDILRGIRELIRAHRMALSWRQDDLAQKSGVGIATLRRFEKTGRISFPNFAKLIVTLGLADKFLDAMKPPRPEPKSIKDFLAATPRLRQRAPRHKKGN
jgi:transcriptional regulator with XRE-family HTH domain